MAYPYKFPIRWRERTLVPGDRCAGRVPLIAAGDPAPGALSQSSRLRAPRRPLPSIAYSLQAFGGCRSEPGATRELATDRFLLPFATLSFPQGYPTVSRVD